MYKFVELNPTGSKAELQMSGNGTFNCCDFTCNRLYVHIDTVRRLTESVV